MESELKQGDTGSCSTVQVTLFLWQLFFICKMNKLDERSVASSTLFVSKANM